MPPDRKARDDDTIQPRGKKKSGVRGPPKFLIFRSKPAIDADRVASQTVPPRPSDRRESAAASPPAADEPPSPSPSAADDDADAAAAAKPPPPKDPPPPAANFAATLRAGVDSQGAFR